MKYVLRISSKSIITTFQSGMHIIWNLTFSRCYINNFTRSSAISRAILKPVYQFGIPNSNLQTLKSVDFWCKLSSTLLVAEPREQCFELFRKQNNQKFPGFHPWTPLGRAYSTAPDSPAAQRFFSSLCLSKNRHPKKIAGYGTEEICLFHQHYTLQFEKVEKTCSILFL